MPYICQRCGGRFTRAQRGAGHCPHRGVPFETAELVALCIGLICTYFITLVLPEALAALAHASTWQMPSDTIVLARATIAGGLLIGALLTLSARFALWQGAALRRRRWLRLLWLAAAPGVLYAGAVLIAGVAFVALRQRRPLRHALTQFLAESAA